MKSFIPAICIALLMVPEADAHCRVQCQQVQEVFVATPYAVGVGVPVATYAPVGYSYTPSPQPVNVTVNINSDSIADAVVKRLTQAPSAPAAKEATDETPGTNSPKEQPGIDAGEASKLRTENEEYKTWMGGYKQWYKAESPKYAPTGAVAANCLKCHGTGGRAVAKIDLSDLSRLSCEQRLAAARKVLAQKMPPGKPLSAEATGDVLEELVGK